MAALLVTIGTLAAASPSADKACSPEILGPEPYEQKVASTDLHCSKPAEQCSGNHEGSVPYTWPADPGTHAPRRALLESMAAFLSPPVLDPQVRLLSAWIPLGMEVKGPR